MRTSIFLGPGTLECAPDGEGVICAEFGFMAPSDCELQGAMNRAAVRLEIQLQAEEAAVDLSFCLEGASRPLAYVSLSPERAEELARALVFVSKKLRK